MNLYEELVGLVTILEDSGLDYALCGGVALAFHGHPRFTKDIDLLVREEDLEAVRKAVTKCGFTVPGGRVPLRIGKPDEQILHRVSKVSGSEALTLDLMLVSPGLEIVVATSSPDASSLRCKSAPRVEPRSSSTR